MKDISLAAAAFFLATSCAGLPTRSSDISTGRAISAVGVDQPGPRPIGYDRWYEPQWGPPYTVSEGYVWIYRD